uniref:Uncharacterized protein n=1 Tax=Poecilia reticulata TaxID=8081 RepID=A0A3P9PJN3_POERE
VKGAVNLEEEEAGQQTQKSTGTPTGRPAPGEHLLTTRLVLGSRAAMRSYSSILDWSMSAFSSQVASS